MVFPISDRYTNPKFWGPHYWYVMRATAFNYPQNPTAFQKNITKRFYINLQYMLPCEMCRNNYATLLKKIPIEPNMCCGRCLTKWVNQIYTEVSKHAKK